MAANTAPIFTRMGAIGRGVELKNIAATDYNGISIETRMVFEGDVTNGAFIERIRFKSKGTNIQTVARIFINNGGHNRNWATAPAAPSGVGSATGGTMLAGTYYAKIVAIGPGLSQSALGTQSAAVTVPATNALGSIAWSWTAVTGSVGYRVYVSDVTGTQTRYFDVTTPTNAYTQTAMQATTINDDPFTGNQVLYGEITLPATTAVANAATPDIDYYMNIAIEPGSQIYVGLGTAVAAGWACIAIGGIY